MGRPATASDSSSKAYCDRFELVIGSPQVHRLRTGLSYGKAVECRDGMGRNEQGEPGPPTTVDRPGKNERFTSIEGPTSRASGRGFAATNGRR